MAAKTSPFAIIVLTLNSVLLAAALAAAAPSDGASGDRPAAALPDAPTTQSTAERPAPATRPVTAALPPMPPMPGKPAEIVLRNGLVLHGEALETPGIVTFRNAAGEVRIPREEIERITYLGKSATRRPDNDRSTAAARGGAAKPSGESGADKAGRAGDMPRGPVRRDQSGPAKDGAAGHEKDASQPDRAEPSADAVADSAGGAATDPARPAALPPAPLLSPRDIQRLKLSELASDGPPEDVRVKFLGKNQADFFRGVHQELMKRPDYQESWGQTLLRGTPTERLQLLITTTGLEHLERIDVESDPAAFDVYRRRVLPALQKSCARSGCHAGAEAAGFRFPAGPTQGDAYVYSSFAMLDRLETSHGPLIDRTDPAGSPLIHYLLPTVDNPKPHPPVARGRLHPFVKQRRDPQLGAIVDWINSLKTPQPDYRLEAYVSRDAAPATDNPAADAEPQATEAGPATTTQPR